MGATVLLIDYDPRSTARIRTLLHASGYLTEVARDGIAGIRAFERLNPDLTLVQDLLPKRHGFEVCKTLKQSVQGKHAPIVIIKSCYGNRGRDLELTEYDACLQKPFTAATLLNTVQTFLPAPASPAPRSDPARRKAPAKPQRTASPDIPVELTEQDITDKLDSVIALGPPDQPAKTSSGKASSKPERKRSKKKPREASSRAGSRKRASRRKKA